MGQASYGQQPFGGYGNNQGYGQRSGYGAGGSNYGAGGSSYGGGMKPGYGQTNNYGGGQGRVSFFLQISP